MTTAEGKTELLPRTIAEGCTVAVLGKRDVVTRRVETALHRTCKFQYHRSPEDLFKVLSGLRSGKRLRGCGAPAFYLFNFFGKCEEWSSGREANRQMHLRQQAEWLDAVQRLNACDPSTPILITADQHASQSLIRRALHAGANEVIGSEESAIPELVQARIKTLIVAFKAYRAALTCLDPLLAEKAAQAPAVQDNPTDASTVHEEPDEQLSRAERDQALSRLRDAAGRPHDLGSRHGPDLQLLEIAVPALRADSGRLDAKRIAERFGISTRKLAGALPLTHQALSGNPDSLRIQADLYPFARIAGILDELLPGEPGRQWLNSPHKRLRNRTPLQAMLGGDAERVARMLEIVREGGVGG